MCIWVIVLFVSFLIFWEDYFKFFYAACIDLEISNSETVMKPAICFGKAIRRFHYSAPEGLLFWPFLYESLVQVVFLAGVYRCHSMLRCSLVQTGDLVGTLIVISSSTVLVISIFLKMECP